MKASVYLAGACIVAAAAIVFLFVSSKGEESDIILEYSVKGGIWGRNDGVVIDASGNAVYRVGGSAVRSVKLPEQVLSSLKTRLDKLLSSYPHGLKLEPEGGADYFIYSLAARKGGALLTYVWTDLSKAPLELSHLHDLLRAVTASLESDVNILVYIDAGEPEAEVGATRRIRVTIFNLMPEDFHYTAPTPCHPDARVVLHREGVEPAEIYPVGFDPNRLCVQVLEARVLKARGSISLEYDLHLSERGEYAIEASFPYAEERRFTAWARLAAGS